MVNLATFSVVTCIVLDSQFTFLECFLNLLAFGVQFSTLWFHNIHQSFLAECGLLCQICIVELLKFLLLLTEFLPEFIIGFSLLINFTELLYILWSKSLSCVLSLFVDALHSEYAWLGEGEVGHVVYILFHVLKFSQIKNLELFLDGGIDVGDLFFDVIQAISQCLCLPGWAFNWSFLLHFFSILWVSLRVNDLLMVWSAKPELRLILELDIGTLSSLHCITLWHLLLLLLLSHLFWDRWLRIKPGMDVTDYIEDVWAILENIPAVKQAIWDDLGLRMDIIVDDSGEYNHVWSLLWEWTRAINTDV